MEENRKQLKKYYFVATKEECSEWYQRERTYPSLWTIDNTSGSPHESREDAINELENLKGSYPTKLIVVKSNEDINSSKEANREVMDEVDYQINVLNT